MKTITEDILYIMQEISVMRQLENTSKIKAGPFIYMPEGMHFSEQILYNTKTNQHITDNLLRQQGFDRLFKTNYGKGTSNEQLMLENGFVEIYDAGQATYIYNNE